MTEWRIRCPDLDAEWSAAEGESSLESTERADIELLSAFRNGACRICICQLVACEVCYRMEWPRLSREEKAGGGLGPALCGRGQQFP